MTVRHQQTTDRTASGIVGRFEAEIAAGRLSAGDALPSVRVLAAQLDVSPATVAAAYKQLRARGSVISAERKGVRVAPRPPLTGPVAAAPVPPGVRDLASGNPDPALLPRVPRLEAVAGEHGLYGGSANLPALVGLARDQLSADGISAPGLAVCSGALDAIERVLGAHARNGDRVAVEDPGYPGVLDLVRALGLQPVGVALDDRGLRPDALQQALAHDVVALVWTPRAQNPTGAATDHERAGKLRAVLEARPAVLVVEDDHAGPVAGADLQTLTCGRQRWAVTRSVSKSLGPDLRLAVVAGDARTIAGVEGRQRLGPGWVSHLLQRVVVALWSDDGAVAQVQAAASAYACRRDALVAALADHGIPASGCSGLNVWVPVAKEEPIVRGLLGRGWAVRAGEASRLRSQAAVRITTATLRPVEAPDLADDLADILRPSDATRWA